MGCYYPSENWRLSRVDNLLPVRLSDFEVRTVEAEQGVTMKSIGYKTEAPDFARIVRIRLLPDPEMFHRLPGMGRPG